jgi:hypothetical protein
MKCEKCGGCARANLYGICAPPRPPDFHILRLCGCACVLTAKSSLERRSVGVLSYNCTTDYYCLPGGAGVRLQGKEKEA